MAKPSRLGEKYPSPPADHCAIPRPVVLVGYREDCRLILVVDFQAFAPRFEVNPSAMRMSHSFCAFHTELDEETTGGAGEEAESGTLGEMSRTEAKFVNLADACVALCSSAFCRFALLLFMGAYKGGTFSIACCWI